MKSMAAFLSLLVSHLSLSSNEVTPYTGNADWHFGTYVVDIQCVMNIHVYVCTHRNIIWVRRCVSVGIAFHTCSRMCTGSTHCVVHAKCVYEHSAFLCMCSGMSMPVEYLNLMCVQTHPGCLMIV